MGSLDLIQDADRHFFIALAAAVLALATPVFAQDAPAADPAALPRFHL